MVRVTVIATSIGSAMRDAPAPPIHTEAGTQEVHAQVRATPGHTGSAQPAHSASAAPPDSPAAGANTGGGLASAFHKLSPFRARPRSVVTLSAEWGISE